MKLLIASALFLAEILPATAGKIHATPSDPVISSAQFRTLAGQCAPAVNAQTLASIVRTESGFHPFRIGINSRASAVADSAGHVVRKRMRTGDRLLRQPLNVIEAVATAQDLIAKGYNIDVGLGQINSDNFARLNLIVQSVFDPCVNLAASANLLQTSFVAAKPRYKSDQDALLATISQYNTGNYSRGFDNGYVAKVKRSARLVNSNEIFPTMP